MQSTTTPEMARKPIAEWSGLDTRWLRRRRRKTTLWSRSWQGIGSADLACRFSEDCIIREEIVGNGFDPVLYCVNVVVVLMYNGEGGGEYCRKGNWIITNNSCAFRWLFIDWSRECCDSCRCLEIKLQWTIPVRFVHCLLIDRWNAVILVRSF